MLSSSFWIRSLTMSSAWCRMCMASSLVQFSKRTESMASSRSPGSRVPVLADTRGRSITTVNRDLHQNPISPASPLDPWEVTLTSPSTSSTLSPSEMYLPHWSNFNNLILLGLLFHSRHTNRCLLTLGETFSSEVTIHTCVLCFLFWCQRWSGAFRVSYLLVKQKKILGKTERQEKNHVTSNRFKMF